MLDDLDGSPRARFDPAVLDLPVHQVGSDDRSGRRRPVGSGADDGVVGVQLAEERQTITERVGVLVEADLAPIPAVAHDHRPLVPPRSHERRDVERLDIQVVPVAREPGRELLIPDPAAVEGRLVHAVRRRVHARRGGHVGKVEAAPEQLRRPPALRRRRALRRLNPARRPVARLEQTGLEPRRARPRALPGVGDDLDAPVDTRARRHGAVRPGHQHAGRRVDPVTDTTIDVDPVASLSRRTVRKLPGQAWRRVARSEHRAAEVIDAQVLRGSRLAHAPLRAPRPHADAAPLRWIVRSSVPR